MKLIHKVLCIDDNLRLLREVTDAIKEKNDSVGIETQFCRVSVVKKTLTESQSIFRERMRKELDDAYDQHKKFDIILIDLYMQSSTETSIKDPVDGAFFIESIRDSILYTPIIFYSQGNGDERKSLDEQFQDYVRDRGIWKKNLLVYERGELIESLSMILDEIHAGEHQNSIVRGFLMDQISEIDALMNEALAKFWVGLRKNERDEIQKEVIKRIKNEKSRVKNLKSDVANANFEDLISIVIDGKRVNLGSRVNILRAILKAKGFNELESEFKYFNNRYPPGNLKPLVEIRNDFAHKLAKDIESPNYKRIREECRRYLQIAAEISNIDAGGENSD